MKNSRCISTTTYALAFLATLALTPRAGLSSTYYADGACAASGTGTSLACGANGPFKTISEGITAMNAGDTLDIRGAHGSFDGVYVEYIGFWGTSTDGYPGKSLTCTAAAPCVIQGCPASACGSDETPTLSGLVRRTDWTQTSPGSGVWYRVMESRPEKLQVYHFTDDYGPGQILQGDDKTQLQFDTSTAPAEGHFNYDAATHRVYVNPFGTGSPNTDAATKLWVPDHKAIIVGFADEDYNCPSGVGCNGLNYVTLRRLTLEGPRHTGIEINTQPGKWSQGVSGQSLVLDTITIRHVPSYAIYGSRFHNLTIRNVDMQYIGRGVQLTDETPPTMINSWGMRLFNLETATLSGITVRHIGSARANGIACQWCDSPWNNPSTNASGGYGTGMDIKQSAYVTVNGFTCTDTSGWCLQNDVTHDADYSNMDFSGGASGLFVREFTPSGDVIRNYNVRIHESRIDNVGFNQDAGAIVVFPMHPLNPGEYGVQIYNNVITRTAGAGIRVNTADKISIWNNSIWGGRSPLGYAGFGVNTPNDGIKILNTVTNLDVRNNIINNVEGDALEVHANSTGGTFDYNDILNTNASCSDNSSGGTVRWGVTGYDGANNVSTGGTCYTTVSAFRAAQPTKEVHGISADPTFVSTAVPADLHIQASSPAKDAGIALSFGTAPIDIDGQPRPQGSGWDMGADEYSSSTGAAPSAPTLLEAVPVAQ